MKNTLITIAASTALLTGVSQAATIANFQGSGVTLVEINWSTSTTPVADGNNTTLKGGVEGTFAVAENSYSWTSRQEWNSRSNAWTYPGLTIGTGGNSIIGHGYNTGTSLLELTTTATVAAGTYDVYVFYTDNTDDVDGGVSAALSGGTFNEYHDGDGDIDFGNAPGSTWNLYAKKLGQQTGTELSIDIGRVTTNDRTTPVGIGYALVPEPSSTALLGLGGLALILRRRR